MQWWAELISYTTRDAIKLHLVQETTVRYDVGGACVTCNHLIPMAPQQQGVSMIGSMGPRSGANAYEGTHNIKTQM